MGGRVPEGLVDFRAEFGSLGSIVHIGIGEVQVAHLQIGEWADKILAELHGLETLAEKDLLEADDAALVHREIDPVDEDPIVGLTDGPTLREAAQAVVHEGEHARIHLADEVAITCVLIIVIDRLEPVEGVVEDGVDVGRDGILAAQLTDGAFHCVAVEAQIIVHQIGLNGIARPGPAVALDAVHHEFTRGEVHRICPDLPDAVQFLVGTFERTTACEVLRQIFVLHADAFDRHPLGKHDLHEAEGFRLGDYEARRGFDLKFVERFAIFLVERFGFTFAVIEFDDAVALNAVEDDVTHGLLAEIDEKGCGFPV